MADLKLFIGYPGVSSWSLRGWLAARKSGLAFEHELIDYRREEGRARLKATSPNGLVPLLRHKRTDGDLLVWESLAVCEYLAELAPDARLWPEDRDARALARSVAAEMHGGFAALRNAMDMALLERRETNIDAKAQADIDRVTAIWKQCRERYGETADGPYLFGHFTIADAMYAPVATRFRTYGVQLDGVAAAYGDAILRDPDMLVWEDMARRDPAPPKT